MAQLKKILYRSALDYVAERYHADAALLAFLCIFQASRLSGEPQRPILCRFLCRGRLLFRPSFQ
jgi:hypothetical protein